VMGSRPPLRRIFTVGNSDFAEGGGGEPLETEMVAERRGSAGGGGAAALPIGGLLPAVMMVPPRPS
jgi:hypothetical protein